jgi:hypothetical protein
MYLRLISLYESMLLKVPVSSTSNWWWWEPCDYCFSKQWSQSIMSLTPRSTLSLLSLPREKRLRQIRNVMCAVSVFITHAANARTTVLRKMLIAKPAPARKTMRLCAGTKMKDMSVANGSVDKTVLMAL